MSHKAGGSCAEEARRQAVAVWRHIIMLLIIITRRRFLALSLRCLFVLLHARCVYFFFFVLAPIWLI